MERNLAILLSTALSVVNVNEEDEEGGVAVVDLEFGCWIDKRKL